MRNIAERLRAEGVKPLPDDRSIARELELDDFYIRIYRPGSEVSHYSIGTMLDGFLELTHDKIIGPVSLEMPDPDKATNVLIMAAITYGLFLPLSENVIPHGPRSKALDLSPKRTRRGPTTTVLIRCWSLKTRRKRALTSESPKNL